MKQKKITIVVLFFIYALLLGSCKKAVGTAEDNAVPNVQEDVEEQEGYLFGFSGITMDNPYYITLEAALSEELLSSGEHQLDTKDPEGDSDLQLEQIREMIAAGVDAIFLSPVDLEAIEPALVELREAGVKIINIDTMVKNVEYIDAYIGSDNKKAGHLCALDLIERCPEGGKIVILEGANINSITERITGFEEVLAQAENGFTIVSRKDVQGDLELARTAAQEAFAADEDIVAVMCGNDQTALGALVAAKEVGLHEVNIYGVDGSPDLKKELAKSDSMIAGTAAQSPIDMGKAAARVGIAMLSGEPYEKETYIEVSFVYHDNIDMYGTDGWQ